jgi:hypothetical protein
MGFPAREPLDGHGREEDQGSECKKASRRSHRRPPRQFDRVG